MSLIKIWKEKGKILEGIKNNIFKKEHVEEIYEERLKVCIACPDLDIKGDDCYVKGTRPCCKLCGCSLGLKLRSLSAKCDADKWNQILNEDEEDMLNKNMEE